MINKNNMPTKREKNIFLKDSIIIILFIVFAGFLSISYGMERGYDTRNYHIYNPYAFLTDRLSVDIMPANIQSYFNPILDIPYYLAIKYFNDYPSIITFLYGFSYALFLFVIYKISVLIFKNYNTYIMVLISVLIASGISKVVRCIGWLSHDIFIADLFLIALYLILKIMENNKYCPKMLITVGIILGSALGFKYTAVIFTVPMLVTFLIFYNQIKSPLKSFGWLLLGTILGFIIVDAFWMIKLYALFANPLYPYFNWLFHSPDINSADVFTSDFHFRTLSSLKKILMFPLSYNPDLRLSFLWYVFIINLITIPFINKEKFKLDFNIDLRYTDFILMFCFVSYVFFAKTLFIMRYFSPILGFAGITAIVVIIKLFYLGKNLIEFLAEKFIKRKLEINIIEKINVFVIITALYFLYIFFPNYNLGPEKKLLRVPVEDKILDVEDMNIPDNSVVLTGGGVGILIPFQNKNVSYYHINDVKKVRVGINILSDKTINKIKEKMLKNPDNVYIINKINLEKYNDIDILKLKNKIKKYLIKSPKKINSADAKLYELDKLGIDISKSECRQIKTNIKDIQNKYKINYYYCKLKLNIHE